MTLPFVQILRALLITTLLLTVPGFAAAQDGGMLDKLDSFGKSVGQSLGITSDANPYLPPDEAYILSVDSTADNGARLHWDIANGYYLYRDKIHVAVVSPSTVQIAGLETPAGTIKEDEYFGKMEIYHNQVDATVSFTRQATAAVPVTLKIGYQGCAEGGFCYPPLSKQIDITLPAMAAGADNAPAAGGGPLSEQDLIADQLGGDQAWLTALGLFGVGLLLAFTPCIFPMIPILSSIIVGEGENVTTRRAFTLSLIYVLAMALTYTVAGVFAGLFGENLQALLQSPWSIIPFSLLFIVLALSMFGFYELQLPQSWQTRLNEMSNRQSRGKFIGVAIMGALSALIVGPCVAAPLAGVLIYIGLSGDAVTGGFSLFMMSLGMGLPLLIVGTSAGKLMPRAGAWMTTIKAIFGVMLLGLAIWMLERILPDPVALSLWGILLIGCGVYMGALSRLEATAGGWQKLWKALGFVALLYGALMIIGAAGGGDDVWQPLKGLRLSATDTSGGGHTAFEPVKGISGLQAELDAASLRGQPVMVDFYADWCVECKHLEKRTFSDPDVIQSLSGVHLLQADVTANDPRDQALLKQFGLFGPPAILFFDRQGQELRRSRLIGFLDSDAFVDHVRSTYPPR
jgi:thiol:disulfide interchange protein DsbD